VPAHNLTRVMNIMGIGPMLEANQGVRLLGAASVTAKPGSSK
jgi:hypothetical protein